MVDVTTGNAAVADAPPQEFDSALEEAFSADETPAEETAEETTEETPAETEPAVEEETPAAETTEEPAAEETAPETEAEPAKPQPELPEGVTMRERKDGKKEYVFSEARYNALYPKYQVARKIEHEILGGEPLTIEAIKLRDNALAGQQRLHTDFFAGDPESHGNIVRHFIRQGEIARENGDVDANPMGAFAQNIVDVLVNEDIDSFCAMRDRILSHYLPAVIKTAAQKDDKNLRLAAQYLQKSIFGKFDKPEQLAEDPHAGRAAELDRRERNLQQESARREQERWRDWNTQADTATDKVKQDSVADFVKEVAKSYEKFPKHFANLKDALHREIEKATGSPEWKRRVDDLKRRAQTSRSAQTREEIRQQLETMHRNRAKAVLEDAGPGVMAEYAEMLRTRSAQNNARRAEAETRRAPNGAGAPPKTSLAPKLPEDEEGKVWWEKALTASLK